MLLDGQIVERDYTRAGGQATGRISVTAATGDAAKARQSGEIHLAPLAMDA